MTDDLIDRLAAAVAERISRPIPIQVDLWSADEIAAYLKVCRRYVIDRYSKLPDFPPAIRLPSAGGRSGHPRWRASDVIAWAEKYKEGAPGRIGRPRKAA
ncbi:helix-turn-helix transcriptional regulator [Pelomicrobium methylotrophicum]|uniref:Prophage CP4-57 regulatory protein (AlpA) n=1 Tax=Pelomicrobium methylotrophicum TaxID=2602750 RepID=A0A5C7EFX6_9PROT|nr:hypothetical protein [Pelomicrobium methylotrophicum]TXF09821.1 hypothetical protein FR698_16535 [Pelomicrobium methylotrophicum]